MTLRLLPAALLRWCLPVLLALSSLAARAAGPDLAELMNLLAQTKTARASFVEQKYIALLDKPVESTGELSFIAPDVLEKRILTPRAEAIRLQGSEIILERGKRTLRASLEDFPDAAVFVESIRATLAGDRRALESTWRVTTEGSLARWTLRLSPIVSNAYVERIRISGARDEVRQIEIEQKDGDRSVMQVTRLPAP